MTTENEKYNFTSIAHQFVMNLRALRVFNDRIGAAAVEHDRLALDSFMDTFKTLMPEGTLPEEKEEEEEESAIDSPAANHEDSNKDIATPDPEDARIVTAQELKNDPKKMEKLVRAAMSFAKAAPIQARLLRTSVLISLMSYLEALIADLIHAFYARFPQALPAEDRTLSLAELREIGSVEEAEAFLTAKEVDSVLRESLDSQLQYFSKRFKVDLKALDEHKPVTIEIDQRRNLFVHNRGIVNRTYLERVDPKLVEKYEAGKDKKLPIKSDYLRQAMNTVEVAGIVLLQQCWRKWDKTEVASADDFLIDATFDGLLEERYEVVDQLAQYAATTPFENEASKRTVCINHTIALRDSGRSDEIENVLGQYDWSGYELKFRVALCAVRGQEDEFYRLLPRAIAAGEIKRGNLEEWPLFRNFRNTERFSEVIKTCPTDQDETNNSGT